MQMQPEGWGEGLDIGVSFAAIKEMRDEAIADRLEVITGRGERENWKEISASTLPTMFKTFRKVLAEQLTARFNLDTTPSEHVQLALKMNPSINMSVDSPLLIGKSAFAELAEGVYRRALKRQAVKQASRLEPSAFAPAPAPAPATDSAAPAAASPAATAPAAAPAAKRRRSLLGAVAVKQSVVVEEQGGEGASLLDLKVSAEVEKFEQIRCKVLAKVRRCAHTAGLPTSSLAHPPCDAHQLTRAPPVRARASTTSTTSTPTASTCVLLG